MGGDGLSFRGGRKEMRPGVEEGRETDDSVEELVGDSSFCSAALWRDRRSVVVFLMVTSK